MADTNKVKFAMVEESTRGTTPASAGQLLNFAGSQLRNNRTTQVPNVIRGDLRNFAPVILQETGAWTLPAVPLQFGNFALPLEGVCKSDRTADLAITGTGISFTSPDTIADTGNGLGGIAVGRAFFVTGAGAGANANKWFVATAGGAGSVTVEGGVATQAAGSTVNINGTMLVDGYTEKWYTFQEDYSAAVASNFRSEAGAGVENYSVNWQVGNLPTETASGQGNKPVWGNATVFTGADIAAPAFEYMNPLGDFGGLYVGGTALTAVIASFGFTIASPLRPRFGVGGTAGPSEIGLNKITPSATLRLYFDANARTQLDVADAFTSTQLRWDVVDAEGNRRLYLLPATKFVTGDGDVPGPDQDAMADFTITAFHDTVYDYQVGIFEYTAP